MVDIYVAEFPFPCWNQEIYPAMRKDAIEKCTHPETRNQKYYVWKLLEYGLENSLGCNMKDAGLSPAPYGGWQCQVCKISLSHSKNVVAVAISDSAVGLDIETSDRNFTSGLIKKILTESEISEYEKASAELKQDYMLKLWTQKEAIFKQSGLKIFSPSKTEVLNKNIYSKKLDINNKEYMLSVATDNTDEIRIFLPFNL